MIRRDEQDTLSLFFPPSFITPLPLPQVTSTSVELHYFSNRPGLHSWVVGILEAVGTEYFHLEMKFQLLRGREDGTDDHEVRRGGRGCSWEDGT